MKSGVNLLMITLTRDTNGVTTADARINGTEVFRLENISHEMALAVNIAICQGVVGRTVRLWPETTGGVGFQAIWHDDEV